jgi:uncharacterized repeat protein (TIGR03803 family)
MHNVRALQVRLLTLTLAIGILPVSASAQVYKKIFDFNSNSVGADPNGSLVFDSAGNLYGTAEGGGSCSVVSSGCGLVFELSPSSGGGWTETILHTFSGTDGNLPTAGVVFDSHGNLYGTTYEGGAYNKGAVFELTPTASGWQEQVLYSFTGAGDGNIPTYGVVLDSAGNVYGTTVLGGSNDEGVLFQLTGSDSSWTENVLLNFNSSNGTGSSPLAFDAAGNLYGTFGGGGGNYNPYRLGTIYELSPNGLGGWTHSIFFTFTSTFKTGSAPAWGVTFDSSGNLYGTTNGAVPIADVAGEAFELSPPAWNESKLFELTDSTTTHGQRESFSGPLTLDAVGNIYAAVRESGTGAYVPDDGFVFRIGPSGSATFTFPLLQPNNRLYPLGGLAVDGQGNVYGATRPEFSGSFGSVFEVIF